MEKMEGGWGWGFFVGILLEMLKKYREKESEKGGFLARGGCGVRERGRQAWIKNP